MATSAQSSYGIALDVDGVLVRDSAVIPQVSDVLC
jgi:ribonucleotide monophosphatase NagD (HAD superfamily)